MSKRTIQSQKYSIILSDAVKMRKSWLWATYENLRKKDETNKNENGIKKTVQTLTISIHFYVALDSTRKK